MATCYPDYQNDESPFESRGERTFYQACRSSLPPEYSVFHSVRWIARSMGEARDGEADFLVCHPGKGFLVVEVKGGRIRANVAAGKWTSTDEGGQVHDISNPFRQASKGKYNIIRKLREHRDWPTLRLQRVIAGHAAFFPNVDDGRILQGPEAPPEIIGDRSDLFQLERWIERAFDYWVDQEECHDCQPLGLAGVRLMRHIFARVAEARPLLATRVAAEEEERLRLTNQQVRILDLLSRQRRVAICGGAGTGKTVLATEKARRLAAEGFKTLLTCYNVPLSEHLRRVCLSEENLEVIGFHKLCKKLIDRAREESGRDLVSEARESYPRKDLWNHYYPIALAYSLEVLVDRYDAIVIDEGQDFGEEFWLPVEMLLADGENSPLYIFYDENQNVYTKASTFPADTAPITLTVNCRNTRQIHRTAYSYYSGTPVEAPPFAGDEIQVLNAPNLDRQAKRIYELVTRLLVTEKVPAPSIAILIADRVRRRQYQEALNKFKLPKNRFWGGVDDRSSRCVTVETVARFKGLEAVVLVLWGLDLLANDERTETLYVGISRAKSVLYLCGSKSNCEAVMAGG